jgi:hypothetical protein
MLRPVRKGRSTMSLTFTLKKALKTGDSSGERIRTTNHRVNRLPGKWVAEEQLIALKGIKKGTLKKARENTFIEYKLAFNLGKSPCFCNIDEIDRWIERQSIARPRRYR